MRKILFGLFIIVTTLYIYHLSSLDPDSPQAKAWMRSKMRSMGYHASDSNLDSIIERFNSNDVLIVGDDSSKTNNLK